MKAFIVRHRLFFNRGYGLIGCFGVGYLVAAKLQEQLIAFYQFRVSLFVLFPFGVFTLWFIGWLEHKLGLWQEESKFIWDVNPKSKRLTEKFDV